jgi:probable blue pigment (indigoidine) exporter
MIVLQPGAHLDPLGVAAGLGGAASMASGVTLTKRWRPASPATPGPSVSNLAFTSWQLVVGGSLLLVASVAAEGAPPSLTTRNLAGFVWLATAGTAVAYALWFRGIARLPVANVSLLGLLSPLVAVTAGYLVLGQHLGVLQFAGIAVVLSALWLGQQPAQAAPRPIVRARIPRVARRLSSAITGKMFASRHC